MVDPFAPPAGDAVVVGAGRLTLDVIVRAGEGPAHARSQAGGTCGNVLADLACLGWRAYPLADLGDDDPGRRYCRDLARFGVHLDLIRHFPDQQTPIVVHHLHARGEQQPEHFYTFACPFCGYQLQNYEPVPLERVEQRLPLVPAAKVFFFDRDSEGALRLARHCRAQGALVVYEPNWAGPESALDEALAVADVFKFSRERLGGLAEQHPLAGPVLLIETLGGDGLRYQDRREDGSWRQQPAFPVAKLRDAGGSGDWCTAGLLHLVGQAGRAGLLAATEGQLREALRFGQALAAWNCAFEGARGGAYAVPPSRWRADVRRILAGERFDPAEDAGPGTLDEAGRFCPRCGGAGTG